MLDNFKRKAVFWKDYFPTPTFTFRRRGREASLQTTSSVRMKYEDADNLHELETGEWTKAAPLEAVQQAKRADNEVVIVDDVDGRLSQDGTPGVFVGYHYNESEVEPQIAYGGDNVLFFAEPADGQLVPVNFSFRESEKAAEDLMERIQDHLPDDVDDDTVSGIEDKLMELAVPEGFDHDLDRHIIQNKDERLNAYLNHLELAADKYVQGGWAEMVRQNQALILTLGTGVSMAILFYAFGQQFSEAIPVLNKLVEELPNLASALQNAGPSPGQTPPGS